MQSYIKRDVRLDGSGRGDSAKRRNHTELGPRNESIKRAHERLKYWLRKFITFLFSQVGVGALLMCYTILGATIFINLESSRDTGLIHKVESLRSEVVSQLWNVTYNYNIIHNEKWRHEVDLIVRNFQNSFLQQIRRGYTGEKDDPWTFPKALMYSLSVYTTIGYGNLTPRTDWGKAITCVYALFGIPLLLLYMANIGDLLATSFREFYVSLERCKKRVERSRVKKQEDSSRGPVAVIDHHKVDRELNQDWILIRQKSQEDQESNEWRTNEVTIPVSTCLGVFFCYIAVGSIFFSWWEGWNYLDGSYFCFVTLFSIGFGDLVPGQTLGRNAQQHVDGQLILCSIYILFGMALMAMCFHLTQERFFIGAKKLGRALHLI